MKNVIVACGGGIATSTIIADKVSELLKEANIENSVTQCTLSELYHEVGKADLVVTSMKVDSDLGVPTVLGTPLLTGIGEEETKKKILDILSK